MVYDFYPTISVFHIPEHEEKSYTISNHEILFYHRFYYVYCIFFLLKLYLLPYSTLTTNCQQLFALKKKNSLEHLTNIHEEKK